MFVFYTMCYYFAKRKYGLNGNLSKLHFASNAEFGKGCCVNLNLEFFQYFSTENHPEKLYNESLCIWLVFAFT